MRERRRPYDSTGFCILRWELGTVLLSNADNNNTSNQLSHTLAAGPVCHVEDTTAPPMVCYSYASWLISDPVVVFRFLSAIFMIISCRCRDQRGFFYLFLNFSIFNLKNKHFQNLFTYKIWIFWLCHDWHGKITLSRRSGWCGSVIWPHHPHWHGGIKLLCSLCVTCQYCFENKFWKIGIAKGSNSENKFLKWSTFKIKYKKIKK